MYSYQEWKPKLFTEENQTAFIKFRDKALKLLDEAGAFKIGKAFKGISAVDDTFTEHAMCDRLVELGDVREITGPDVRGQDRVFVKA